MTNKSLTEHKFEKGDVLFSNYWKVTVVLIDQYDPENLSIPPSWNCHVLGEELKTFIVIEKELKSII